MPETAILNEGDVFVSNARLVAGGTTYAVSGITSVKAVEIVPEARTTSNGGVWLAVGGVAATVALIGMSDGFVWWQPLLLIAGLAGVAYGFKQPDTIHRAPSTYEVIVQTSSGAATALSSGDGEFVKRVVRAVNQAIVQQSTSHGAA